MAIDDNKVVTFKTLLEKYSYLIKSNVSTSNFSTNLKGITKQELLNNTDTNLYFLKALNFIWINLIQKYSQLCLMKIVI